MSPSRLIRLAGTIVGVLALSACRVDTNVSLDVKANGSGKVRITVTADADVVAKAPNLAADLRMDDLKSAGWKVLGPRKTDAGGLTVSLERSFQGPAEASAILRQINGSRGPLHDVVLTRSGKDTSSTWTLGGRLEVKGGVQAFADDAALALLGEGPYAGEIAASGLDIGDAVGVAFELRLPGKLDSTTGSVADGTVSWKVPMDGSVTDIATVATNADVVSSVARVGRYLLYALLVVWVIGAAVLFVMVKSPRGARRRTPRF